MLYYFLYDKNHCSSSIESYLSYYYVDLGSAKKEKQEKSTSEKESSDKEKTDVKDKDTSKKEKDSPKPSSAGKGWVSSISVVRL